MDTEKPPQLPPSEEMKSHKTDISFDLAIGMVKITPKEVNGLSIINPTVAHVSVDNFIEIAATLILARKQAREHQIRQMQIKKS